MDKIPTAEEFLQIHFGFTDEDMLTLKNSLKKDNLIDIGNITDAMEMFAEFHVQAALKAAAETLDHTPSYKEDGFTLDDSEILNAYPLTNIK